MKQNVSQNKPCAVFVANRCFELTNSRLLLMQWLRDEGWQIVIASGYDGTEGQLSNEGFVVYDVNFFRGGLSITNEWRAFRKLYKLFKHHQPRLVHHFNAKPVILGTQALKRVAPRAININTITGLGYAFVESGFMRFLASLGYKWAFRHVSAVVFQNHDDRDLFMQNGWVSDAKAKLIQSSGIDTARFQPKRSTKHDDSLCVVMASRLLWQKGVHEFCQAAASVKQHIPQARFLLAGPYEPGHPDEITENQLHKFCEQTGVEYLGRYERLEQFLQQADLFVYPSYYREGIPRVILEAGACAVPVIAANVPGSREGVIHGKTGYLVPKGEHEAITEAIYDLLTSSEKRRQMGDHARRLMEERFDRIIVSKQYWDLYHAYLPLQKSLVT